MIIKIESKIQNQLLGRTEVVCFTEFQGKTPTNETMHEEVAKALGAKPEVVVIKKIATTIGKQSATIKAYMYTSEAEKKRIEPKLTKAQKTKVEAAAKKAEEAAEAKKAEKEAEAKKTAEAKAAEPKAEVAKPAEPKKAEENKPAEKSE